MNFEGLKQKFPNLVSSLEAKGYSSAYIGLIKREMTWIAEHEEGNRWKTYSDIYAERARSVDSGGTCDRIRIIMDIIARFDLYDIVPDRTQRPSVVAPKGAYYKLNDSYRGIVDFYKDVAAKQGKKKHTIKCEASSASCFLLAMQKRGCNELFRITQSDVVAVFRNENGKLIRGTSYRKNISAVLRVAKELDPVCEQVLAFLPKIPSRNKNIQRITQSESEAIRQTLSDTNPLLSLRDKAIGLMLLLTGLRASDITALCLGDIDWQGECIRIVQQKTEEPLEIPLSVAVGNAVYNYLRYERPQTDVPQIFVSARQPFRPLKPNTLDYVVAKIFSAAGIRQKPHDHQGTHLFRHRVATLMLQNDITRPVISEILGHVSPASLEPYLGADIEHLRECTLDISCFPIDKGVFDICPASTRF